ncbi:MAG: rod shape-determining protein MreC [Candidatus Methylacidiphilales bacterium]|nr:rod shape-determining protein MreC [Candidatus Methylacidiphilales bacterium]
MIVLLAQLVLLAVQVKNNQDVRLIRVWAVTAITPLARVLEGVRANTIGLAGEYWELWNVRSVNKQLQAELDKTKLENHYLREELATAKRAEAMAAFVQRNPSKTIGARIIGAGAGASSKVVFIDRGSTSGVMRGMAVITPDGIVGKVTSAYPTGSMVVMITDPTFACGVISNKTRIHATAKGQGNNQLLVDYIQNEQTVEVGEVFYTSGDDRIFPKGLPVGTVRVAKPGKLFKEVYIAPTAFDKGLEEVLVVLEGVHQQLPEWNLQTGEGPMAKPLPPPEGSGDAVPVPASPTPATAPASTSSEGVGPTTDADRLLNRYKELGAEQGVTFGAGGKIPNFNAPKTPKPAPEKN